jgi:hypothetical protein
VAERRVVVFVVGNLPFCSRAEVDAALVDVLPEQVMRVSVAPEVGELIKCSCCGFACDGLASRSRLQ